MTHLLLATVENPHDPSSWSGTAFHLRQALEGSFDRVTVLSSPVPRKHPVDAAIRLMAGRARYPMWMTRHALHGYAASLRSAIAQHRPDAVLSISSQHLALLGPCQVPTFMVSDAPWMAYQDAYAAYDPRPWRAEAFARLEAQAARHTRAVIYPSPWACREAQERFGLPASRVVLAPFGANRFCGRTELEVSGMIERRLDGPVRLLFVGKDWERKGGPLALATLRALRAQGVNARLTIVGCRPPLEPGDVEHVNALGFLSANDPAQARLLERAFIKSDLFILPSKAECYGLVLAEAQSYGLPCVALNVHGLPGVVEHGVTGLLFEPGAAAHTVASAIRSLAVDPLRYRAMARAARLRFRRELNWEAFGVRVHTVVTQASA
jgi:glycosyltransferase involved in cell wall biosynthesis